MTTPKGVVGERRSAKEPFFSICIPQYNRTEFLLAGLRTIANQTFRDFEVCISDDVSTDGGTDAILAFLEASDLSYAFAKRETNGRYDANLRSSVALATGRYCFLLGNDDGLVHENVLGDLHSAIVEAGVPVGVAVTNFLDVSSDDVVRRIRATTLERGTPFLAATRFRNFAFVGGVILDRRLAHEARTDEHDGTEFYQTYVACRILASGGFLLSVDQVAVSMGLQIEDREVDSHASRPRLDPCPIEERRLNLDGIGRLVFKTIEPFADGASRARLVTVIMLQMYAITYPYWIFRYREVQSWNYALGVCMGMRPRNSLADLDLPALHRAALGAAYGGVTLAGLITPMAAFERARPLLYSLSKRLASWKHGR